MSWRVVALHCTRSPPFEPPDVPLPTKLDVDAVGDGGLDDARGRRNGVADGPGFAGAEFGVCWRRGRWGVCKWLEDAPAPESECGLVICGGRDPSTRGGIGGGCGGDPRGAWPPSAYCIVSDVSGTGMGIFGGRGGGPGSAAGRECLLAACWGWGNRGVPANGGSSTCIGTGGYAACGANPPTNPPVEWRPPGLFPPLPPAPEPSVRCPNASATAFGSVEVDVRPPLVVLLCLAFIACAESGGDGSAGAA